LIGLLQHVPPDALVGLLPVPGTAPRSPEQGHDAAQILDVIALHILKIYHILASFARYFLLLAQFFCVFPPPQGPEIHGRPRRRPEDRRSGPLCAIRDGASGQSFRPWASASDRLL